MKKKIIIFLVSISLIFLAGGIYIISTIETSTSTLDYLIKLHQVEILREHLLLQIKRVQSDLNLWGTPRSRSIETVVTNIRQLDKVSATCYDCHHSPGVQVRLNNLTEGVEKYKKAYSRSLTTRGNRQRVDNEVDEAFHIAEKLLADVKNMVHMAASKLADKTQSSLRDIHRTKIILFILVSITPFLAAGLGYIVIRAQTTPIGKLLTATRKLKAGDLDFRIEGLHNEFGEVAASFNSMADALKHHMHEIHEREKRYRVLFEGAGDAIFLVDAEGENLGDIVEVNPAAAEMHQYTIEELLGLNLIKDLDTPDASKKAPERVKRIMNGEWITEEITHQKKDGTVFPVEINAGLLEFMGHKYILALDRDISNRKEMENKVLQAKHEWEATFDAITDMITIHDGDFNIIRANKAAIDTLKLPLLENNQVKCYEYYHGTNSPPDDCLSCESLNTGKHLSFETYETHLGMHLEVRAMPRYDDNNQLVGIVHVVRDITERKRVEEVMQRAQQMKIVGEWAAGLVHEIKNPLAGIKVSVEVLLEEHNISAEDREIVLKAVDEIKRIEALLKSLLHFARPPKLQLSVVYMNDLLDQTIDFSLRHPSLSSNSSIKINVIKDFDDTIPETMADPMQLQQVLLNLAFNAIEAMPDGGTLGVKSIYDKNLHAIKIEISDTGLGIDKGVLDDVFKPFFTTKLKGTGLGLAITRQIVEQHGGVISVESDTGKGTVFKILLNIKEEKKKI